MLVLCRAGALETWDVMSESMFGDAGAARNSRRRSTSRGGSAKSPATTPGQSQGVLHQRPEILMSNSQPQSSLAGPVSLAYIYQASGVLKHSLAAHILLPNLIAESPPQRLQKVTKYPNAPASLCRKPV